MERRHAATRSAEFLGRLHRRAARRPFRRRGECRSARRGRRRRNAALPLTEDSLANPHPPSAAALGPPSPALRERCTRNRFLHENLDSCTRITSARIPGQRPADYIENENRRRQTAACFQSAASPMSAATRRLNGPERIVASPGRLDIRPQNLAEPVLFSFESY